MFLNSISYFFFSPGVHPVMRNAMVFVVPSSLSLHIPDELRSSYFTLLIVVCITLCRTALFISIKK